MYPEHHFSSLSSSFTNLKKSNNKKTNNQTTTKKPNQTTIKNHHHTLMRTHIQEESTSAIIFIISYPFPLSYLLFKTISRKQLMKLCATAHLRKTASNPSRNDPILLLLATILCLQLQIYTRWCWPMEKDAGGATRRSSCIFLVLLFICCCINLVKRVKHVHELVTVFSTDFWRIYVTYQNIAVCWFIFPVCTRKIPG